MSDVSIPEDLKRAAKACYLECEQMDSDGIVETIGKFLMAERQSGQEQQARNPEEFLFAYSTATGDEEWATLADRISSAFEAHKALIAAKDAEQSQAVENERLRFEGDLDKWMKIIGAGITGYQPEAYTVMDLACEELVRARAEIERLRNKVSARALTDKQLSDEISAVDAVCAGGFGEGGGSPGEWWYERADELEHERKRRELEAQLSAHNRSALNASEREGA